MIVDRDLVEAVRYRWQLVAGSVAVVLLLVAIWTLVSPRLYSSTAKLLFDSFETDPGAATTGGTAVSPTTTMLGTQSDIIRSSLVASQVARDLKLDQDPGTIANWKQATGGRRS